ncbi:hypothetical protein BGZ54_003352 [Gamsiella multidivaricata]|nr:hypothetical protein BGZ54_003352 [Gamsiella multidivaricata]
MSYNAFSTKPMTSIEAPELSHGCRDTTSQPSPLSIPEILQGICRYLDRQALVHTSRVSKQFWACTEPFLWTTIPEHAWESDHFLSKWHQQASRIITLRCGPHVDLACVSLYCRNLVSLDVSRIKHPIIDTDDIDGIDSITSSINRRYSGNNKYASRHASGLNNHSSAGKQAMHDVSEDSYESFLRMTEVLIRVLENNRRFPPRLIQALAKLDYLEILSLNAWRDFQEYSLELIMNACPRLSHLSLGENDFTRFTLENFRVPDMPKSELACIDSSKLYVKLEQFDNPIKGRNRSFDNEQQDSLAIHSKRAVLYTSTSPSTQDIAVQLTSHNGLPLHQQQHQHLYHHSMAGLSPVIPQSRIKSLSLHQAGLRQEFLVNLTRQCPELEHLSLLNGWGFYPSSQFASILSQLCPRLSRLEFREQSLDLQDEFFILLCHNFPQLQLIHAGKTGFSRGALDAVRVHCRFIVSLNLDGARGIPSLAMDRIMRSCGSLKALSAQGVVLNGRDLSHGSRWACLGLEVLVLDIEIYSLATEETPVRTTATEAARSTPSADSVKSIRARVYDHLADLIRLKTLGLGGGHRVGGKEAGLDLTLESGLERLTSLHCLERLDIRRMVRTQSEEDLAWMVQHWPQFRFLEASASRAYQRGTDKTHRAIEWLCQSRPGMDIKLY